MTLQAILDNQALEMLPKIQIAIKSADSFSSNQMINRTLRECMNSSTPLVDMNKEEIDKFQNRLIEKFKFYKWID